MSQSVEWARASSEPRLEDDPDWSDPYGTAIDEGKVGVWLDEVLIEGTIDEIRLLARRLNELMDRFDTASSASRQHYIDTGRYLRVGEAEGSTT